MDPSMLKRVKAQYSEFNAALRFVKNAKIPICEYAVYAQPRDEEDFWGHANTAEHIAAAICLARQASRESCGEDPDEIKNHVAVKKGRIIKIFQNAEEADQAEEYAADEDNPEFLGLIGFERMTKKEIKEAKDTWLAEALEQVKERKSTKKRSEAIAKMLSEVDPFKMEMMHPYLPKPDARGKLASWQAQNRFEWQ
jgi:hypothetical protein